MMQAATSPSPSTPYGSSTKPRRLSASSQHTRRTLDFSRYTGKTPSLIASLNSGRAAAAPSAAIAGADDAEDEDEDEDDDINSPGYQNPDLYGGSGGISGRRKGVIFKCETCSKEYRHPNCLIKHRWEHSPHWANSTKVPLSKHQQVQLLEGAAILAHLGNTSNLPEDRAVWPSWTSGGTLPMPTGTRDPLALAFQADEQSMAGSVYGGDDEDGLDVASSIALDDELEEDDAGQPSASVEPASGLRRSLRPRSRSAGALLAMARSSRSGGIAKSVPAKSLVVGGGVRKKAGPVKAGFVAPAHTRVTQVAPGVLLAPSEEDVATSAPIAISIPTTPARFHPGHNHHNLSISSIGSVVSNGPISPSSVSARSPISASFGLSGLEVLASLSLGQSPGPNHLALSPAVGSIPLSGASYTYARSGSVAPSNSGSAGNTTFSISSSLPQSSVRSSSGDSDELPEVDEDLDDEMEMGGRHGGERRKHEEEWEDGMDFQMDM